VVRVPEYRSWGPGSIPGATRFSEKKWVWNGVHTASWVQLRSYLEEKVAAPVYKTEITAVWNTSRWPRDTFYPQKLVLTSPTSGGRSVGIVRSRNEADRFRLDSLFRLSGTVILWFSVCDLHSCWTHGQSHFDFRNCEDLNVGVNCDSLPTAWCIILAEKLIIRPLLKKYYFYFHR
jgi:hypothetical protein